MNSYISICLFASILLTGAYAGPNARDKITSNDNVSAKAAHRIVTRELWVTNGGQWGTWSSPEFCEDGYYASGFSLKIEPKQGKGDDTALNAIRLKCRKGTNSPNTGGTIVANEGPWGRWSRDINCPTGKRFVRFRLQVEPKQGKGDDTAANSVKFKCRNLKGGWKSTVGKSGFWGHFGSWSKTCPNGSAICGMKVRIEPHQGKGDDTSLNNVLFYCCK